MLLFQHRVIERASRGDGYWLVLRDLHLIYLLPFDNVILPHILHRWLYITVHGKARLVPSHGHRALNGVKYLQGIPAEWRTHGLDPFRPEVLRRRAQTVTGVSFNADIPASADLVKMPKPSWLCRDQKGHYDCWSFLNTPVSISISISTTTF